MLGSYKRKCTKCGKLLYACETKTGEHKIEWSECTKGTCLPTTQLPDKKINSTEIINTEN